MCDSDIKVSIICNTYNHEKYIKDALNGFLMQKAEFKYEILIHDDASTDGTADIIREYEEKFPDIIKPIYQNVNQYSQNIDVTFAHQLPRAKGTYIALCEGDDYWTDSLKLQKQFSLMEKHPEIDICAHTASVMNASTNKIFSYIKPSNKQSIFNIEEVIIGGGSFVATNSLFYRKSLNIQIPEFRDFLPLDYTLQIHGALRGGMLYLPENMSTYRYLVPGSWTNRMKNVKMYDEHYKKMQKMLELLDCYTEGKYTDTIKERSYEEMYLFIEQTKQYDMLSQEDINKWYRNKPISWKAKALIKRYFPQLVQYYRKVGR